MLKRVLAELDGKVVIEQHTAPRRSQHVDADRGQARCAWPKKAKVEVKSDSTRPEKVKRPVEAKPKPLDGEAPEDEDDEELDESDDTDNVDLDDEDEGAGGEQPN
jgi:hypothetical protein